MTLRRESNTSAGVLVVLNLCLAFGATALLGRMGPAIAEIMQANDYSIVAAEEVLVEFARAQGRPLSAASQEAVRRSVSRMNSNVTESAERPLIAVIESHLERAFEAREDAIERIVAAVSGILEVNRAAMHAADLEAQRLGGAGAWVVVGLGVASLWAIIAVFVRLGRRVLNPLLDLHEVLDLARRGDRFRRCRSRAAPLEVVQVTSAVNRLLDERGNHGVDAAQRGRSGDGALSSLLTQLVETFPEPVVLLHRDGTKAGLNSRAIARLAGDEGGAITVALEAVAQGGAPEPGVLSANALGGAGWLCRLGPPGVGGSPAAAPLGG
ncbi:MAG: hypothetical protein AB7O52_00715 [Planctomycetota bacterium]